MAAAVENPVQLGGMTVPGPTPLAEALFNQASNPRRVNQSQQLTETQLGDIPSILLPEGHDLREQTGRDLREPTLSARDESEPVPRGPPPLPEPYPQFPTERTEEFQSGSTASGSEQSGSESSGSYASSGDRSPGSINSGISELERQSQHSSRSGHLQGVHQSSNPTLAQMAAAPMGGAFEEIVQEASGQARFQQQYNQEQPASEPEQILQQVPQGQATNRMEEMRSKYGMSPEEEKRRNRQFKMSMLLQLDQLRSLNPDVPQMKMSDELDEIEYTFLKFHTSSQVAQKMATMKMYLHGLSLVCIALLKYLRLGKFENMSTRVRKVLESKEQQAKIYQLACKYLRGGGFGAEMQLLWVFAIMVLEDVSLEKFRFNPMPLLRSVVGKETIPETDQGETKSPEKSSGGGGIMNVLGSMMGEEGTRGFLGDMFKNFMGGGSSDEPRSSAPPDPDTVEVNEDAEDNMSDMSDIL